MRNIRKFETFDDFVASQEAVSGSGKYVQDIWPGFAYVKERYDDGTYAFYNGTEEEEYEFGDIVYYDGSDKLKKVYWSAFTPSLGEKVGLVVVPTVLSPDGNARIMAFGSLADEYDDEETPAASVNPEAKKAGDEKELVMGANPGEATMHGLYWYYTYINDDQTFYTCVPSFYLDSGEKGGDNNMRASVPGNEGPPTHYESPTPIYQIDSYSSDIFVNNIQNPYTSGEGYDDTGYVAISPFLGDTLDKQDPAYLQEELEGGSIAPSRNTKGLNLGGGNYNAFSDFSGYTWTYGCPPSDGDTTVDSIQPGTELKSAKPIPEGSYHFPHDAVKLFYTDGTAQGDWYLPSMGEMGFVAARFRMIAEQIMPHLYNVGALNEYDNFSNYEQEFFTSTVATTYDGGLSLANNPSILAASTTGNMTYPNLAPVRMRYDSDWVGFIAESTNDWNGPWGYVLPFAMINGGKIQRTIGDYTIANGHQVKDIKSNAE